MDFFFLFFFANQNLNLAQTLQMFKRTGQANIRAIVSLSTRSKFTLVLIRHGERYLSECIPRFRKLNFTLEQVLGMKRTSLLVGMIALYP